MGRYAKTIGKLLDAIGAWAHEHHPDELGASIRTWLGPGKPTEESVLAALGFALSVQPVEGASLAERYAAGRSLPRAERTVLAAWKNARFTILQVRAVERDKGLHVRDVMADEELFVPERSATHSVPPGAWLLGSIARFERDWELNSGLLSVAGPTRIRVVQALLADPVDPLEVIAVYHRSFRPPRLVNTEGDDVVPLELTLDLSWSALTERARTWSDAHIDGDDVTLVLDEPSDLLGGAPAIWASLHHDDGATRAIVNSVAREERLLARLENVEVVERLELETPSDPEGEPMVVDQGLAQGGDAEDVQARFHADHLERWADEPIPALDGQTPREALSAGRIAEVRALAPDHADDAFWTDLGIPA
jgi:hypothetical protein